MRQRWKGWLGIALAGWLAGCGGGATQAPAASAAAGRSPAVLSLRLGLPDSTVPDLPNSVLWLAAQHGFYTRAGLDVTIVPFAGTAPLIAALRTGEVDAANVATQDVLQLSASGQLPLQAFVSSDDQFHFLIAARTGIDSLAALKGKPFAIYQPGSLDDLMSRIVLTHLGVDPNSVDWVAVGNPPTRAQALIAGRVQATTVSLATWQPIERTAGLHVLVDPTTFFNAAPIVQKVLAARPDILKSKAAAMQRLVTALIQASRYYATHQSAWVSAVAADRSDLKPAALDAVWTDLKGSWAVNGSLNLTQYAQTEQILRTNGVLKHVAQIPVSQWTDATFVDQALSRLGVDKSGDDPGRSIA